MLDLPLFMRRHSALLTRLLVCAGTLVLLVAIGYVAAEVNPFLALGLMLAPVAVLVLLRHTGLGLVAMVVVAVFVRFRIPTGTASEIVISLLICGVILALWVARMLIVDKRVVLRRAPVNLPLLAFVAVVFISLLWGRVYRDPLVRDFGSPFVSIASAVVIALLPATLLLAANLLEGQRWLRATVWTFLGVGAVSLALSLAADPRVGSVKALQSFLVSNRFLGVNLQGLFSTWYIALGMALALFHRRLHWAWRAALAALVVGWVYWGFWLRTSWLSGWVPAFVAAAAIAFMHSKRLFIVLLIIVVAAGVYYWQTQFDAEVGESGETRLMAYEVNWRVTGKHLFLGTGPAGYAAYYMSYFPTEAMASHNTYIDVLAQMGMVGLFFYLWLFGAQLWGGYSFLLTLRGRGDFAEGLAAGVVGGTLACVVAMALGDWLLPFAYTQGIAGFDSAMINWLLMGTLWALRHTVPLSMLSTSTQDTGGATA